jgi:hypothetical protein
MLLLNDLLKEEVSLARKIHHIKNVGRFFSQKPRNPQGLLAYIIFLCIIFACTETLPQTNKNEVVHTENPHRSVKLALWLAKKDELIANGDANYDLVMTGWIENAEAEEIRARNPSAKLLAGLTHTYIYNDPALLALLITIAKNGDAAGPNQITEDMYMMFDDDANGTLDRRCSVPGWDKIHAMDPRHPGWRALVAAFYKTVSDQPQHDGVVIDMVDEYPFCDGAWSSGVPTPIDPPTWVAAQSELLDLIGERVPPEQWIIANAGRDFPAGSPFPQYLNGYVLENFLGEWGSGLADGLASAKRAIETTKEPHIVVFAVDTDDTGVISWPRFRTGMTASMLLDNTYFAFDFGARDHGGVNDWWFSEFYDVYLGNPLGPYSLDNHVYRRDFERGIILIPADQSTDILLETPHMDIFTGETGTGFTIYKEDARILIPAEGE